LNLRQWDDFHVSFIARQNVYRNEIVTFRWPAILVSAKNYCAERRRPWKGR